MHYQGATHLGTYFSDEKAMNRPAKLGEDKPSPLLCHEQVAPSSIVGAMACPRPARANASLVGTQAHCKNLTRTPIAGCGGRHLDSRRGDGVA